MFPRSQMPRYTALAFAILLGVGCVPRDRLNTACRWGNDPPAVLDLANSAQRNHLTLDVIIAEELAVRYADASAAPPRGPVRDQCLARLFPEISRAHGVSIPEIEAARGRREGMWDVGVLALFALAYGALALRAIDRIRRSFSGSLWATAAALAVAALPIAIVATVAGEMWALMAEGVRVSNLGHLSGFRGNRVPWRHHRAEIFAGAVALYSVVAIVRARLRPASADPALRPTTS